MRAGPLGRLRMNNSNKIKSISVHKAETPFYLLGSRWIGRQKPDHLDSTIVIVETVSGFIGIDGSYPARGALRSDPCSAKRSRFVTESGT